MTPVVRNARNATAVEWLILAGCVAHVMSFALPAMPAPPGMTGGAGWIACYSSFRFFFEAPGILIGDAAQAGLGTGHGVIVYCSCLWLVNIVAWSAAWRFLRDSRTASPWLAAIYVVTALSVWGILSPPVRQLMRVNYGYYVWAIGCDFVLIGVTLRMRWRRATSGFPVITD